MCGLTGFILEHPTEPGERLTETVAAMTATLTHRGPDDSGVWADPAAGVALGHRRLSVVDLSPQGHQPMVSACGRYVVAFNGEIYNFRDLRDQLERQGAAPAWRGHSDTEVLLAAIAHWGLEPALERLNGMFAFALWDRETRALHLARDRLGEKPLYYGWTQGVLFFASELKALRAHPKWQGRIERGALALFLRHSYVPAPYSIYEGVHKLEPGQALSLSASDGARPGSERTWRYWSAREIIGDALASPFRGGEAEAIEALDGLLRDAVALRMEADVPLGAFLSGGFDSSTVVALMQAQSDRPVRTFSIGFHEEDHNEAVHAKAVAEHLGTAHTELYVTPDEAQAVIPRLPALYDEPFGDSSQIPTALVAELTRRHVTVALSGDGGDELFGGYNRYLWGRVAWRQVGWLPRGLRRGIARGMTGVPAERWNKLLGALSGALPRRFRYKNPGDKIHKLAEVVGVPSGEALYRRLVSHWKRPAELVKGAQEPSTLFTAQEPLAEIGGFLQRMMFLDLMTYLPDDILVKVDRATMGVSLESRIPLLDHRVIELAWRLPMRMKVRAGRGKWILRELLARYVPRELMERPKMGFGVPIRDWLRGPLREWGEELLAEPRLRREGFFHPAPIRDKWEEHLAGRRNWQYYLWDVLMFQAWLEDLEGGAASAPTATAEASPAAGEALGRRAQRR